jgi:hypothetical protein
MMRRCLAFLAVVAGGVFDPARADASGIADVPLRPTDHAGARFSASGTASPQSDAVKTLAFIPALAGAWRLHDRWTISVDAAASLSSYRFAGSARGEIARFANPMIGAQTRMFDSERVSLRLGVAAGAPLLTVPGGLTRNAAAEHADRAATAATGQRFYWLWARNVVPLVLLGRLEYTIEELVVRVDLEPGFLISVNRDPSSVALLGTFEAAVRLGSLSPGVRLTSLFTSRERDTHDFSQTTAAAVLRWDGDTIFGSAEAVTGIDGPQGSSQRDQTSWGVTLGAGARF